MIPDFLMSEGRKKEKSEFRKAIDRYTEHFGKNDLITEPSTWSEEKWVQILDECIAQNKTIWELFGEEYNPDAYY